MRFTYRFASLLVALAALTAGAGFEAFVVHPARAEFAALRDENARLARQVAQLRIANRAAASEAWAATAAASGIAPSVAATTAANDAAAEERRAWLARTLQLKELLAAEPEQMIPEIRLLDDRQWLAAARRAAFDSEEHIRRALAGVRDLACSEFVGRMSGALGRYTRATNGQLPADLAQLAPFFDAPPDAAMLQRYRMIASGRVADLRPGAWAIEEVAVMDPGHDSFYHVQASGGYGATSGRGALEFAGFERAVETFRQAHGREPASAEEVWPYARPPLTPAQRQVVLERLGAPEK